MFTSCRHNIQIALTIYCSNRWLTSDVLSVEVPEVPPPWASVSSWSKSERATNTMESFLLNCSTPSASLQAPGRQGKQSRADTAGLHPGTVCRVCSLGSSRLPGSKSFPGPLLSLLLSSWLCVCMFVCVHRYVHMCAAESVRKTPCRWLGSLADELRLVPGNSSLGVVRCLCFSESPLKTHLRREL